MLTDNVAVTMPEDAEERLVSSAPVLITEQQIALATAAALRPRPEPRHRWVAARHLLLEAFHSARVPSPQRGSAKGHDYPKRYGFLEDACLAREMYHL
ncbi:MAG: hypothetical protein QOE12_1692 [Mycobacterium sp.]|jgi:hypothetical protein|nr:hypothetical protein [Mycobacterium sp.]